MSRRHATTGETAEGWRLGRFDVVLAVTVALAVALLLSLRTVFDHTAPGVAWWTSVFPIVAGLALMFRRIRPLMTLLAIVAVVASYILFVDSPGPITIPLLIGLYTVASLGDRRTSIVIAALVAVLVSVLALTVAPETPSAAGIGAAMLLATVPVLIGDTVRSRRALIAETDKRVRLATEAAAQEVREQVLDERVRIARELHDVVAHSIATINVQAGVAAHVIDQQPAAAKDALVEIKESSKSALAELRSMLGVLRDTDDDTTPLAPSPGIEEISTLIDRYVGAISYDTIAAPSVPVDPVVGLVAYRIAQEGLTNVIKHAPGASVEVRLEYLSDSLVLTVRNDGRRSNPDSMPDAAAADLAASVPEGSGLGLVGLAERVRAVGGTFTAERRFDSGFDVTAELPYVPSRSSVSAAPSASRNDVN
ncbi:MAG: sensor histidine kinase [Ilumatobacter sp.]